MDLHEFYTGKSFDAWTYFGAHPATVKGQKGWIFRTYAPSALRISLLLTEETRFRSGDLLDVAYHEAAHLWESHHGEAFCRVEHKLRQSMRRWMTEKEFLASIAGIKSL